MSDDAARQASWAAGLSTLATAGAAVLALVAASAATGAGELSVVMLAVVALTALAVAEAASGLPAAAVSVVAGRAAAQRLVPLLELDPASRPVGTGRPVGADGPARPAQPTPDAPGPVLLRAAELSAGWPGRPAVHENLSVHVGPGGALALVVPSGSGKTTLLLTLAGLLPPAAGSVQVPGGALFTAEDAHVFGTTVRENLRLAAPEADDATLVDALTRAGLGDWLAGLPDAVVERARAVLRQLEEGETSGKAARLVDDLPLFSVAAQREAPKPKVPDLLVETLAGVHPDDMTPREALEALYRLKALASKNS